jgi:hypothetical protein
MLKKRQLPHFFNSGPEYAVFLPSINDLASMIDAALPCGYRLLKNKTLDS